VHLPVNPPLLPMLSKVASALPEGPDWLFEPKWDGFRALVFRDGDEVFLQSRDGKPLGRYFPELVEQLAAQLPRRCVLDGEIVIAGPHGLEFEALQLRLHPAASRVAMLAKQMPSSMVFWDVLCLDDRDLRTMQFADRRAELERVLAKTQPPLHLTPITADRAKATDWFERFEGAGLDGVMAKLASGLYQPNKRTMLKIKHARECDCVVAGFRWHKGSDGTAVGSLLLGLYSGDGSLQHVGVCASFTAARRRELVTELSTYRADALRDHPWQSWSQAVAETMADGQRIPGGQSRWSQGKDLSWEPLRAELVVEVAYDHMQGSRFRHTAQFRRWRQDKSPRDCTYAQLEVVAPAELAAIFGS
jgi:ATP-dependent DNA ligase